MKWSPLYYNSVPNTLPPPPNTPLLHYQLVGLDHDLATLTPNTRIESVYTQALVLAMQMTDALLSQNRFRGGGNATHWPYGGDWIQWCKTPSSTGPGRCSGTLFVPAVLAPAAGAAKDAPTVLSPNKIRVFSPSGGTETWTLPLSWVGKKLRCRAIGDGAVPPTTSVDGRVLTLTDLPKSTPVIITVAASL